MNRKKEKVSIDTNLLEALIIEALNQGYAGFVYRKHNNPGSEHHIQEIAQYTKEKWNGFFLKQCGGFLETVRKLAYIYNKLNKLKQRSRLPSQYMGQYLEIREKYGRLIQLGLKPSAMVKKTIPLEQKDSGFDIGPAFGDSIAENSLLMLRIECGLIK
jgi:hypothetical protein